MKQTTLTLHKTDSLFCAECLALYAWKRFLESVCKYPNIMYPTSMGYTTSWRSLQDIHSLGAVVKQDLCAFCVQSVYTNVSGCIHRHTVGTHAPAACSNVTANTTAVPKCAHSDCPFWLSCISIIVRAHFRASCLRLCWLPRCTKILLRSRLQHSKHTERRTTDIYIYIYEKSQLNSLVWGSLVLAPTMFCKYAWHTKCGFYWNPSIHPRNR